MKRIAYRDGYKYQLAKDYTTTVAVLPPAGIAIPFITLTRDGVLTVKEGYAWDGCSGPTWDDKTNMRGSLIHDALYQLMRGGYLGIEHRPTADNEFHSACLADGMNRLRAWIYFKSVRTFGGPCAESAIENVLLAP